MHLVDGGLGLLTVIGLGKVGGRSSFVLFVK